jgi:glycosyltransferase involved in cell wall biosynthesis
MNFINKSIIFFIKQFLKIFRIHVNSESFRASYSPLHPVLIYFKNAIKQGHLHNIPKIKFFNKVKIHPRKKNLLFVCHEASLSGVPVLTLNMIRLFKKNYNIIVLMLGDGPLINSFIKEKVILVNYFLYNKQSCSINIALEKIVKKYPIDFAIINSVECRASLDFLYTNGIKNLLFIHEFLSCYLNPKNILIDLKKINQEIIFSSEITKKDAIESLDDQFLHKKLVIPQGKSVISTKNNNYKKNKKLEAHIMNFKNDNDYLITGAGSIEYRKGVDIFINVANLLQKNKKLNFKFIWIGKVIDPLYFNSLKDQIKRMNLINNFIFLGESKNYDDIFKFSDLFILSSRLDPLPNVAIDAFYNNLPVICFDKATGILDFYKKINLSKYFTAQYLDSHEMAKKIIYFFNNKNKINKSQLIKAEAKRYYNMKIYFKKINNILLDKK